MLQSLRTARGIFRSLRIYYGDRAHATTMDRLYAQFIKPGDLVFDVGAHVGDRVASFLRLGARVIAVEPQAPLARLLRVRYGWRGVAIEPVAIGRAPGEIELRINIDNPTVSTVSEHFVKAARGAAGWETQVWTRTTRVPVKTLDALIAQHGRPSFIKIDVEGFEAEALAGLTQPVATLSFEFTTIQRDVAHECLARCQGLGYAAFNASLGESQTFVHADWVDTATMAQWVTDLPHAANSGDIYARLA